MNELRVGTPVVVAGITLIPVERLRVITTARRQGCWFQATKEVFAVVICDANGAHAIDVNGHSLSIDYLHEKVLELQAVLLVD